MKWNCPVCEWADLDIDPKLEDYNICPQCGVEFGFEAKELYPYIREAWIKAGRPTWRGCADDSAWLGDAVLEAAWNELR